MNGFFEFAGGLTVGLAKAYSSDPDTFLALTGGVLSASRPCALRGLGRGLLFYTACRRLDQYVEVLRVTYLMGVRSKERYERTGA